MTTAPPVLRLAHVDAGYGGRLAIHDVSLTVTAGQCVGLIGPNGAGKSTLFRVALGTLATWRGTVELFGVPPRRLDRRRQPVAYVPQARRLDGSFPASARDVVGMGRVGRRGLFRFPGAADRTAVAQAIEQVGLAHKADRPFGALSGGEQQRVLLARALAAEARLLLLDEPATGVDVATQAELHRVINQLVAAGCAVVVSTHDLSAVNLARFDWLLCLNGGVIAQGPPDEVTSLDVWRRLFSGRPAELAGG
jgi:manganese/iron transport system ATP-binding protein